MLAGHFQPSILAIKRSVILFSTLVLGLTTASAGDFARTLSQEEIQSAGLAKLTPEELNRLEALVQRYKATEVAAPKATEPALAPAPKTGKLMPDWVGALLTLEKANNRREKAEALESRLTGSFSGWTGRSTFRLENGQLWEQANSDSYVYSPSLKSPKVKIYPASFGVYWLEIEGVHQRCRVKPVALE